MRRNEAARLTGVVKALERDIEITAAYGLQGTTRLLRAARLDLLAQIHGISDAELQALSDALAGKKSARSIFAEKI
jgi:hypothetical protein